jgi:lysophospholipase L1-like esterase
MQPAFDRSVEPRAFRAYLKKVGVANVAGLAASMALIPVIWWSYVAPHVRAFHVVGILIAIGLLAASKGVPPARIIASTLLAFFLGLAVVDAASPYFDNAPRSLVKPIYSFREAAADPAAFVSWWNAYAARWRKVQREIEIPDPDGALPFVLRPLTHAKFFDSDISINSRGFRDREFNIDKGDAFRIVAMGESTTMDVSIFAGARPWPVLLQEMVSHELACVRPIEIINAGVDSYNLRDNLIRLRRDVLPLKPDLIISYHGINGFSFIDPSILPAAMRDPPLPKARGSHLLGEAEFLIRVALFKARYKMATDPSSIDDGQLLVTTYGDLYRQFIAAARGTQVMLASFNIAVDRSSPTDAIDFYAQAFPHVRRQIMALEAHNRLIRLLSDGKTVHYVDTSDGLFGRFDSDVFIDLVHFTKSGSAQLARNLTQPLLALLSKVGDLGCHRLATAVQ